MQTRRILIADDDQSIRELLRDFFSGEGFEVSEAANGTEAVRKARHRPFDVILTDLKMPDRDGIDVLRQIRTISEETAVFILTGYPSPETSVQALELDIDGYVSKPVDLGRLKSLIMMGMIRRKEKTRGE